MKALLIVDMQNDFMPGGGLPVPEADKIIPLINRLQDKFELVFATQDWHPENHISFQMWPKHCVQKTYGARFAELLKRDKIQFVIPKGIHIDKDEYSAFQSRLNPGDVSLRSILMNYDVKKLHLCGVATEICVKANALDAQKFGFKTYMIADACKGINVDAQKESYFKMIQAGINIIQSSDLL